MNISHKSKGLTLLEIIISIGILGIMAIIFINMFGGSFSNVLIMGNKTKSVEKAQGIIEKAWKSEIIVVAGRSILTLDGISKFVSADDLNRYDEGIESKYCTQDANIKGYNYVKLSVAVFYNNGKKHIVISSFMPKGDV